MSRGSEKRSPADVRGSGPVPAGERAGSEYADFEIALRVGLDRLRLRLKIPQAPMSIPEILPVIQSLTDAIVTAAEREVARGGRKVACGPGCGSCCRQLVPVGEAEAIYLADVAARMEPHRRARILQRFRAARTILEKSGLIGALGSTDGRQSPLGRRQLGLEYFRLAIPCPFLEEESCSIHRHRPLACREYVVTSDPRWCARPDLGGLELVALPRRPSNVLYRFGDGVGAAPARWLALPLALEWASRAGAPLRGRTFPAPGLIRNFVLRLAD